VKSFVTGREAVAIDDKTAWKEVQRARKTADLPKPKLSRLDPPRLGAQGTRTAPRRSRSASGSRTADVQTTERDIQVFLTQSSDHRYLPR
jgi:hypothetical protein